MGTLIILIISISSANQDEVYHPLNMDLVDLHGTLLSLLYKVLSLYYTPLDNSSELQKHEYKTTSFQSKESQHGLFVGKDAGKPLASTKRRTRSNNAELKLSLIPCNDEMFITLRDSYDLVV